jgi:hypothetical protein
VAVPAAPAAGPRARPVRERPPRALVAASPAPAPAPVAAAPAPVAAPEPARPPADAELRVKITPWCNLTVDGQDRGTSSQLLRLAPGKHHVECKNPLSGAQLTRDLTLAPGTHEELQAHLYNPTTITARLTRGDAFAVGSDAAAAGARTVEPGRRRVTLYARGRELETRYLDIRPEGCVLVDQPELACQRP